MKRKQSCGILGAEMIENGIHRMARATRRAGAWAGKVGTMTALLALVGVLAGPDLPNGDAPTGVGLMRRIAGL